MDDKKLNNEVGFVPEPAEITANQAETALSTHESASNLNAGATSAPDGSLEQHAYLSNEGTVIEPSPNFQPVVEEHEPVVEQTDDNIEIGSNHLDENSVDNSEVYSHSEPQVGNITPVAPAETAPAQEPAPIVPSVASPSKTTRKALIAVVAVMAVACIGVLIFVFLKK